MTEMTDTLFAKIDVCVDCLMLIANGEVTGENGEDIAAAHTELMDAQWPAVDGFDVVPNCPDDCEGHFSWTPCRGCGSSLGGDRHPAAVFQRGGDA